MKKILFAIQVFVLIAALPIYIIVELNHVSTASPLLKKASEFSEIQEKPVILVLTNITVAFESQYLAFKKHNEATIKSN